jgi:hypothetical protein
MKVALCFLISGEQILNQERLWRKWIEPNKDIINVYFHYAKYETIRSSWIREHTLPPKFIVNTSYYHVVPAYFSLMTYAMMADKENKWFCFLTDACAPIISPSKFLTLFEEYREKSIMSWKRAWWNPTYQKRANLRYLFREYHLGNDPWFVLTKQDALACLQFRKRETRIFNIVCRGGLANESIFAIILKFCNRLQGVINKVTHLTDWERMESPTSPYMFREMTAENERFIKAGLQKNEMVMFLRKVAPEFPEKYIHQLAGCVA